MLKSRKQQRKNAKQLKKMQMVAFAKHQPVEKVISEMLNSRQRKSERKKNKSRVKHEDVKTIKSQYNENSNSDEDITYEQYLKEVEEKKLRIIDDIDNSKYDDVEIHRYSKLLGIKDGKNSHKPFENEGLDYLLDFCDSEKRKQLLTEMPSEDITIRGEDLESEESDEADNFVEIDLSEGEQEETLCTHKCNGDADSLRDIEKHLTTRNNNYEASTDNSFKKDNIKEDIYGRKINRITGEVIGFDPKGAKNKLNELEARGGDDGKLIKIDKILTGMINRLSEATMVKSKQAFLELWQNNSKNDVKSSLTRILWRMLGVPYRLQDQLLSTYAMFLAIIHTSVNSEISAHMVEAFLCDYINLITKPRDSDDKAMENRTILIVLLMNFRIIRSSVILEIFRKLRANLNIDNLQLILILATYSYNVLRRQAWTTFVEELTEVNNDLQSTVFCNLPRAQFLGEAISALRKAPPNNIDMTIINHHIKLFQGILRKDKLGVEKELGMTLEDLLLAEERGRWWIVGSAFRPSITGDGLTSNMSSSYVPIFPTEILELAKKASINTEIRRNVFCSIVSARNDDEAFERLLRLSLKGHQEREIIYVVILMLLKEKRYNPFYPTLISRFCEFDKKFRLTTQYALWDRIREASSLKIRARSHLATLIHHLISHEILALTVLKVIEWGSLTSAVSSIVRRIFTLMSNCPDVKLRRIFEPVIEVHKNPILSDGLRLFLQINFPDNETFRKVETWFAGYL